MSTSSNQKISDLTKFHLREFIKPPGRGKEFTLAGRLATSFTTVASCVAYDGEMDALIKNAIVREWWLYRVLKLRASDTLLVHNACTGGPKNLVEKWFGDNASINVHATLEQAHLVVCEDDSWCLHFLHPSQDFALITDSSKLQFPFPNVHLVRPPYLSEDLSAIRLRLSAELGKLVL